tara:strand:- start:2332 stop:2694 length:363 start_codon:yes stop_codon:yes gene_type:complete
MAWERFEDLEVWQDARELNRRIWSLIQRGCFSHDRPLSDQINRSAGSAMDNVAEGFRSGTNPEFAKFVGYSQRSAAEVQSQLYRARDREHVNEVEFQDAMELARKVERKSGGLIRHLRSS